MKVFPQDLGRFKDLTSAIQSIAVTAALVAGGVWSLFTFNVLGQVEHAHQELDRTRQEIERTNRDLKHRPNVKISIMAARIDVPDAAAKCEEIRVTIENIGNFATQFDLRKAPLQILRVDYSSVDRITYREIVANLQPIPFGPFENNPEDEKLTVSTLFPGESQALTFIAHLPGPGLYWATLGARATLEERSLTEEVGQAGRDSKDITYWSSGALFVAK